MPYRLVILTLFLSTDCPPTSCQPGVRGREGSSGGGLNWQQLHSQLPTCPLSNRDFLLFVLRAQDPVATPASPPSPPDSASAPSTTPASPAAPAQPCGSGNATSDSGNGGGPSPVAAEGPPSATASILCKPLERRAQACVYWGGVGLHKDKEQQPLLLVPRGAYAKLGVGDQFTMVSRISAAKGEMG